MKSIKIKIILSALFISLSGCAQVKPWQKQFLAKPHMAFDPDPLESKSRQHAYTSKEASFGGYGVGGGGCGCN